MQNVGDKEAVVSTTYIFQSLLSRQFDQVTQDGSFQENAHSDYWLSPGVDVPTNDERPYGGRPLGGVFANADAEGGFIPTEAFMAKSPLYRIDILSDILYGVHRTYIHALVGYFREMQDHMSAETLTKQIEVFLLTCAELGILLPEEIAQILTRDSEFRRSAN